MKYLFIADIHINTRKKKVPVEWLKNRFDLLNKEIVKTIQEFKVDAVILGGDIFDLPAPTLSEFEIFWKLLASMSQLPVYIIAGNHEMVDKTTTTFDFLTDVLSELPNVHYIKDVSVINNIGFVPYPHIHNYEQYPDTKILVTHVRGEIPPHVKPEIELSYLDKYDVVFAGDLHARSNSQRNIAYPGSPLNTSFHRKRSKGENGVIVFDDSNAVECCWIDFSHLPQLLRNTITSVDEISKEDTQDWIDWELKTDDPAEKLKAKNMNVTNSKIIKKPESSTPALEISTRWDMVDLEGDLEVFLKTVVNKAEEEALRLVEVFRDTFKDFKVG